MMNKVVNDFLSASEHYERDTGRLRNERDFEILRKDLEKLDYIAREFEATQIDVTIEDYEEGNGSTAEICVDMIFGYLVFDFLESSKSRDYFYRALRNVKTLGFLSTSDKEYFCVSVSFPSVWTDN